jgi:hypothetical protein
MGAGIGVGGPPGTKAWIASTLLLCLSLFKTIVRFIKNSCLLVGIFTFLSNSLFIKSKFFS